jgi:anti-sigma regulatory factor (Ser/Thr protein kinase)
MGGSVGSDELTVLCRGCSNPVGARARCPICGDTSRCAGSPLADDQLDEALLDQVGVALAAQLELATHTAATHLEASASLLEKTLSLRRRLRRQRALLRERVAARGHQARGLNDALARVDEALLVFGGPPPVYPDWSLRTRLPRDRSCPMVARRLVEGHVREDLDDRQAEIALLIVSELATNALLHGEGSILLAVSRRGDRLRLEVSDEGHPAHIGVVEQDETGIGRRGLFLVDRLASRWGATDGTARVWAELALP